MVCPTCKMTIKDDAKFCIHCGTNFNNVVQNNPVGQMPNIQVQQPVQTTTVCPQCKMNIDAGINFCNYCGCKINGSAPAGSIPVTQPQPQQDSNPVDMDKYYQAYFRGKYDKVCRNSFSVGTLFFGFWWFLLYKLYSEAGKFFVTLLCVEIGTGFLTGLLAMIGLRTVLLSIVAFVAGLFVTIKFASEFSACRLTKADYEIDRILKSTTSEEERIKRCKRAGGVNYVVLILMLAVIALFVLGVYAVFKTTMENIERSRKNSILYDTKAYNNELTTQLYSEEIVPIKGNYNSRGTYYALINGKEADSKYYPVDLKDDNITNDSGYVIVESNRSYICVELEYGKNKYVISGYVYELKREDFNNKESCNLKADFPNLKATQLVKKR